MSAARALYVHIPFCRDRCDYCDFFTRVGASPQRVRAVVGRIAAHIDWLEAAGYLARPLGSVYIGGGTPSLLHEPLLNDLFRPIARLISSDTEVTLEANPEDLHIQALRRYVAVGVNRLSIGVQSFDQSVLARLGRRIDPRQNMAALEVVAAEWQGGVSVDLIAAVPGESRTRAHEDLSTIDRVRVDHVSLYELTIEPDTRLARRNERGLVPPQDDDKRATRLRQMADSLRERGFCDYEISSFARPGKEGRHNMAYWRVQPWAATGPGAVGLLPLPGGPGHTHVTRDFRLFLDSPTFGVKDEPLSAIELAEEFAMGGFRTQEGLDLGTFERVFSIPFQYLAQDTLESWSSNVHCPSSATIALNQAGKLLLNRFLVDLFGEFERRSAELPVQPAWPDPPAPPTRNLDS